jgi:ketosteroid isomerase-like protein
MSRENLEVVRRIYKAWNKGDPGLRHIHPAIELQQTAGFLDTGGTFHGHDGVLESARELLGGLRELRWTPHDFIPAPDGQVVVPFSAHGVGRTSKVPVEMRVVHVWTIQDGLAIRMLTYEDLSQALEAVGLRD